MPVKVGSVTIKGGAGVANKNIITPLGVHTEVSAEEMDLLNENGIFKLHKDAGFIAVEEKKADVEKVVADMTTKADPSAPLTPSDYEDEDGAKPSGVDAPVKSGGKKK